MKNLNKVVLAVGIALLPVLSFADTAFSTSTAPTVMLSMIGDVALIIGGVVGAILGLYAALTGLGWGVRKFKHYVSGKKF